MISGVTYDNKLNGFVDKDNIIPYRLYPHARYRTNCYYWINFERQWLKIEEVNYLFENRRYPLLDYAIVIFQDGTRSYICQDLTMYDFRLEKDIYNIRDKNVLNSCSKDSFSGGEIEYWFFKHKINFLDERYRNFHQYLDPRFDTYVDPSKYYYIKFDIIDGIYENVRFIPDGRVKFGNNIPNIPPKASVDNTPANNTESKKGKSDNGKNKSNSKRGRKNKRRNRVAKKGKK